jgi:hypothetical protein
MVTKDTIQFFTKKAPRQYREQMQRQLEELKNTRRFASEADPKVTPGPSTWWEPSQQPVEPWRRVWRRWEPRLDQRITVLIPNQKSRKAGKRFALYETGMTVLEYVLRMARAPHYRRMSETIADIQWDVYHGFIKVE